MRARFLPVGETSTANAVRVDSFPAVVSLDAGGRVCFEDRADTTPVCLLDEYAGNLLIKDQGDSVTVNELPMAQGPLMPGDTLTFGNHRFVVSYERVTSTHPPSATFRLDWQPDSDLSRTVAADESAS